LTNQELVKSFLMYQETKNLSERSIEWYQRTLEASRLWIVARTAVDLPEPTWPVTTARLPVSTAWRKRARSSWCPLSTGPCGSGHPLIHRLKLFGNMVRQ